MTDDYTIKKSCDNCRYLVEDRDVNYSECLACSDKALDEDKYFTKQFSKNGRNCRWWSFDGRLLMQIIENE